MVLHPSIHGDVLPRIGAGKHPVPVQRDLRDVCSEGGGVAGYPDRDVFHPVRQRHPSHLLIPRLWQYVSVLVLVLVPAASVQRKSGGQLTSTCATIRWVFQHGEPCAVLCRGTPRPSGMGALFFVHVNACAYACSHPYDTSNSHSNGSH